MNLFNIARAFRDKKARNWEKLFWAIDLHDTVITGKYNKFNKGAEIFPDAKEVFAWFARRPDMVPILWTSSHDEALKPTLKWLESEGIVFKYRNENPEVVSGELCNFDKKFYFNILLDDKAGFDGMIDWAWVMVELQRIGEWK